MPYLNKFRCYKYYFYTPLLVTYSIFATPDFAATVAGAAVVVGILLVTVAVAVAGGSYACLSWYIALCLPTVQYSIPNLHQFRPALFCVGLPSMHLVEDARCLSLHVDHGAA